MKRQALAPWLALGCALLALSCNDTQQPGVTGSIAIHAVIPPEPVFTGPAGSPAQPAGHLTSAKATAVPASGTPTTVNLTSSSGGFTGTISNLAVGTYTVIVQGFVGTDVDYYGQQTGVSVTANSTSSASPLFQSFVPSIGAFTTPTTWSFRPPVTITAVPNAAGYVVEADRSNTFPNPTKVTTTSGSAWFAASDTGTWYVRVRATNATVTSGGNASATQSIRVVTDLRTSGDSAAAASNLGFFATTTVSLDSLNIYPAADVDWFSLSDCNGDSLTITAQAVRLTPPSPLNSVLLVYNAAGRLVDGNDDGDSTDARVTLLIASDGAYKVRVSGKSGTVGHYRLRVQPKAGANNTGTTCKVVPLAVSSVAAGFLHSCAVRTTGSTDCWGNNLDGQLGNGTTTITSSPTRVSGTQTLVSVTTGRFHSCGRTSTGAAYCWGYNGNGQLGDNTTTSRNTPVQVATTQQFQYVGSGDLFTCGLTTAGSAYCWGDNTSGQLGTGNTTSSSVPVAVISVPTFLSLAVGNNHACGATSGGAVYCWGDNSSGQLGNGGTPTTSSTPVLVTGTGTTLILQGVAAGGNHTCARTSAGAAYCWGSNSDGQLGDGTFTNRSTPVAVQGALAFTGLTGGGYHTCGLVSGTAYCWGDNFDGQLGDGTTTLRTAPTLVAGGLTFQAISAGSWHTCGIKTTTGDAYCWGWNGFGQNGNAAAFDWTAPVPVSLGAPLRSVSTNNQHSCGVTTGNVAYCWGSNSDGQLGDASFVDRLTPVAVSGTYQSVTTGQVHSCALTTGSAVACWGANVDGQLGDGTYTPRSTPLTISGTYQSVAAGGWHTCALSTSTVYCWGDNFSGQLGNGGNLSSNVPVAVAGSYSAVAAGLYHTCAVRTTSGLIDCWGLNGDGQLGNGGIIDRNTPGPISSTVAFQSVTAGSYHTCALTSAGAAYCWGENGSGQLGDNSTTNRLTPVQVSGGLTFQSLNAGNYHTCGVTTTNVLYCWGEGFTGQIGNGAFSDRKVPTLVDGLIAFQGMDAGGYQTCGYSTSGKGYCWGNNERGQLGNGTLTIQTTPAIVVTGPVAAPALAAAGYAAQEDVRWSRRNSTGPTTKPAKPSVPHGPVERGRQPRQ